jgi:hypothetical protein
MVGTDVTMLVTMLDLYKIRSQQNTVMQPVKQVAWVLRAQVVSPQEKI